MRKGKEKVRSRFLPFTGCIKKKYTEQQIAEQMGLDVGEVKNVLERLK